MKNKSTEEPFPPADSGGVDAEDDIQYVVTEKIHGANFSILVDEMDGTNCVRFARRTAVLQDGEEFFGHKPMAEQLEEPAMQVFAAWKLSQISEPVGATMTIYGELFGGHYPHPEVEPVRRRKPVQRGVWYSPGLEFCAFDVAIAMEGGRYYLPFDEARSLVESAGIMFVEPLLRGSLNDCVEMPIVFDSTIPARLGLPPLEAGSNTVEGVVIRSERTPAEGKRFMMKNKTQEFMEKRNERAPKKSGKGAKNGGAKKGGKVKTDGEESNLKQQAGKKGVKEEHDDVKPEALDLKQEALNMVTLQRLQNVVSKIGRLDAAIGDVVQSSLYEDVVADMREEFGSFTPDAEIENVLREGCKSVVTEAMAMEEAFAEKKEVDY